jgi:hypothetical protein
MYIQIFTTRYNEIGDYGRLNFNINNNKASQKGNAPYTLPTLDLLKIQRNKIQRNPQFSAKAR